MSHLSEEAKRSIGLKNKIYVKGSKWFNNGYIETHLKNLQDIPDGFIPGRLPMSLEQREKLCLARRKRVITEETKSKISKSMLGHTTSSQTRRKISKAKKGFRYSEEQRKHLSDAHKGISATDKSKEKNRQSQLRIEIDPLLKKQKLDRTYITKKKNKSFNSSNAEHIVYEYLISKFDNNDIYQQYKDNRYPYMCDFYVKSKDLFIELNLHWTHGKRPFNIEDKDCLRKLDIWKEKAKTSNFYRQAIDVWTRRDVIKRETAERNKLNYLVVYSLQELYNIIK